MSELRDDLAEWIASAQDSRAIVPSSEDYAAADAIIREYYVISRTPLPRTERPVCTFCGVWRCSVCGFRRSNAVRFVQQHCGGCPSTQGEFLDVRHSNHYVYEDHLQALESYSATGSIRDRMQE